MRVSIFVNKVIELKSQGIKQMDIAKILQVSEASITSDLIALREQAKENLAKYTTDYLPLQYRVTITALEDMIHQFWDISERQRITRKRCKQ